MPDDPGALPDPDARARLEDRLVAVRARFVAGLDDRVAELVALAGAASSAMGAEADAARHALARGLHSIAGSAPTIGLPLLGERARLLEAELASAGHEGAPVGRSFIDKVAELHEFARQGAK